MSEKNKDSENENHEFVFNNYSPTISKDLPVEFRNFFLEMIKEMNDQVANPKAKFIISFNLSIDLHITTATLQAGLTTFDFNKPYYQQS